MPDWVSRKGGVIILKNESDEECFKWAVTATLYHEDIKSHPKHISDLRRLEDNYNWSGLEFPLSIKGISKFEIVNVLGVEEKKVYILRGKKYDYRKKVADS